MKNIRLLLAILLLCCAAQTFAQSGRFKQKMEQVKSLKIAFITNELNLTTDEAAKFWPLYNAYDDKQKDLRKQKIGDFLNRRDNNDLDKMSDKDATALLAQMEDTEDQLYQIRKKFVASLKGVLPAVKIIKLKKAEEDFSRKLLEQYRDKGPRR